MVLFDDIGSYPPPDGVKREWMQEAFKNFERNREILSRYIQDAMRQKILAGVEVPNYPQFQDMNQQFLRYINDPERTGQPFLVKEGEAKIVELEALGKVAKEYRESRGGKLKLRVCVTGPIELCYKQFGSGMYADILMNLAKSVDRFVKNSIIDTEFMKTHTVSIDEPSLGISPFAVENDDLIKVFDTASESAARRGVDVQIHLHSPLYYNMIYDTKNINVIGVESATDLSKEKLGNLGAFDKKELEVHDKFLRVGIARTDVYRIAIEVGERHKIDNIWKDIKTLNDYLGKEENPEKIADRLKYAYNKFGERIKYAGPDCGLGTWPSQGTAGMLLENTAKGIKIFRGKIK